MDSAIQTILVGIGPDSDPATLGAAVSLARRENARLTILAAVLEPSALVACVPFALAHDPRSEALAECRRRLRAAVDAVPPDIPVTGLLRRGPARRALRTEGRKHDVVVLGRARRSRIARSLLRRGV